jgi:hypothetical protein
LVNTEDIVIEGMLNEEGLLFQDANSYNFYDWGLKWNNPDFKDSYLNLKDKVNATGIANMSALYGSKNYIGYLEDSEEMYNDVLAASDETGIDVNFLYNVGMYEGIVQNQPYAGRYDAPGGLSFKYGSDFWTNTFWDVGLDSMFDEQDSMINRGYLKSPIQSVGAYEPENYLDMFGAYHQGYDSPEGRTVEHYWSNENEAGDTFTQGDIYAKDAWRGVGGTLRLNEDYVKDIFKKKGYDWEGLDKKTKQFLIYSSYNAGAGNTADLIETYGSDPLSNQEFLNALDYETAEESGMPFITWMSNVMGVVHGTEIVTKSDPWKISK